MANRILWVSARHEPVEAQVLDLKRAFGEDVEIILFQKRIVSVDQILEAYFQDNCDALVFIGPEAVLWRLVDRRDTVEGLRILQALSHFPEEGEKPDFVPKGGEPKIFDGFREIFGHTIHSRIL